MIRRWGALLLALATLLPQAALALHHHEHEEVHDCACGPREAFECSDADCGSPDHHHHHERAHDPATCRTCTADVALILDSADVEVAVTLDSSDSAERALPTSRSIPLWRAGRGPPA